MTDIVERLRYAAKNALGPGGLTSLLVEEAAAEIEKLRQNSFSNGYLLACCNLVNLHDRPELANDVLGEAGITQAEVKAMDLSEYDARALAKIREARPNLGDPIRSN